MKHSSQNYLEVLTARQALLQAELDAVSDRFDEIQESLICIVHWVEEVNELIIWKAIIFGDTNVYLIIMINKVSMKELLYSN